MTKFVFALGLLCVMGIYQVFGSSNQVRVGSYTPLSTESAEVLDAAEFALFSLQHDGDGTKYNVVEILSAESQVVSGINYRLRVLLRSEHGTELHELVVYRQSWTRTWALSSDKLL